MLQSLTLKNFAIVESLDLDFQEGFSVLTGETGAGKSILLDALDLLLGSKADYSKIRSGHEEAILSAVFDISDVPTLKKWLQENDLFDDSEQEIILKRVINRSGKSKNYVNGQPVPLTQLKEIGLYLVDIHGQNAHHSLMTEANQRDLLDEYAHHEKLLDSVSITYHAWKKAQLRLLALEKEQDQWQTELEILEWKNKELSELNPKVGEWDSLSSIYDEMSHRNEMMQIAEQIDDFINKDQGLQEVIARSLLDLNRFTEVDSRFKESEQILQSVETELIEVSSNLRSIYSQAEVDQEELQQIESRMSLLNSMAKKYRISVDELPNEWRDIQSKLQEIQENQNSELLQEQVEKLHSEYRLQADALTQSRKEAAEKLSQEVTEVMQTLSMGSAQFKVEVKTIEASSYGNEQIIFNVAANLGSELKPITKVASGGELSRISLALQVIISQYNDVPTLIFDEVDVGIGGKVADIVGRYLKKLSQQHQILTITHLPQVAVYGNHHYAVNKKDKNEQTISEVRLLSNNERVQEIARMLGGEKITELTLQHAEESLALAHKQ
ncbi:MAG: DNA repair protein RecN [Neisseriaceae bacterium]|nr:DNA repair protein RecN [Neisseriaceae bacterium]